MTTPPTKWCGRQHALALKQATLKWGENKPVWEGSSWQSARILTIPFVYVGCAHKQDPPAHAKQKEADGAYADRKDYLKVLNWKPTGFGPKPASG